MIEHPLRFSGEFWGERFFGYNQSAPDQTVLINVLASISNMPPRFSALPTWLLGGRQELGMDFWSLPLTKEQVRFSSSWLNASAAEFEGDIDTPFLLQNGESGLLVKSVGFETLQQGLKLNGFRLEDLAYAGAAQAAGFDAAEYVVLPSLGTPYQDVPYDVTVDGRKFTLPPYGLSSEPGTVRLFEIVPHDVWFVPCQGDPSFLLTANGILTRGVGFHRVEGWMILFDDPFVLWPDRVVVAMGQRALETTPLSSAARTDITVGACKHAMTYLRTDQSASQFERALAEMAGERVLEQDDQVLKISKHRDGYYYWLKDQGEMWLPGPVCYDVGDQVPGGRGHRIKVRSYWRDGKFWEHPRWKKHSISSRALWPRLPEFTLTHRTDTVVFQGTPGKTQVLSDDPVAIEAWEIIAQDGTLQTLLGLNEIEDRKDVNVMDLVFWELRERLLAVETDLHHWAPARWHLTRNWAERERPIGSTLVPGWTD